jgi:hypothetical protein
MFLISPICRFLRSAVAAATLMDRKSGPRR